MVGPRAGGGNGEQVFSKKRVSAELYYWTKVTHLQLWNGSHTLHSRAEGRSHCRGTEGNDPCHVHPFPSHGVLSWLFFLKDGESSPEEVKYIKLLLTIFLPGCSAFSPRSSWLWGGPRLCVWMLDQASGDFKDSHPTWPCALSREMTQAATQNFCLPWKPVLKAFWSQLSSRRNYLHVGLLKYYKKKHYLPSLIIKIWKLG